MLGVSAIRRSVAAPKKANGENRSKKIEPAAALPSRRLLQQNRPKAVVRADIPVGRVRAITGREQWQQSGSTRSPRRRAPEASGTSREQAHLWTFHLWAIAGLRQVMYRYGLWRPSPRSCTRRTMARRLRGAPDDRSLKRSAPLIRFNCTTCWSNNCLFCSRRCDPHLHRRRRR
jgi:hypothetical protein